MPNLAHNEEALSRAITLYRQYGAKGMRSIPDGRMTDEFMQKNIFAPAQLALQHGPGWHQWLQPPGYKKGDGESIHIQKITGRTRLYSLALGDDAETKIAEKVQIRRGLKRSLLYILTAPTGEKNTKFFFDFASIAPSIAKSIGWPVKEFTDYLFFALTNVEVSLGKHYPRQRVIIPTKQYQLCAHVRFGENIGERYHSQDLSPAGYPVDRWTVNGTTISGPRTKVGPQPENQPSLGISFQSSLYTDGEPIWDSNISTNATKLRGHLAVELKALIK